MECKIDQYYFVYNEQDNVINVVYDKTGINILTIIKLDKKLNSKKEFNTTCSDWYFKKYISQIENIIDNIKVLAENEKYDNELSDNAIAPEEALKDNKLNNEEK